MTKTATTQATATGRVARVTGPVVDVEFPHDSLPEMYNALKTEITMGGETSVLTLELAQHLGDDLLRHYTTMTSSATRITNEFAADESEWRLTFHDFQ